MGTYSIIVRGQTVDLEAVYGQMLAESSVDSGHRVHTRGLKYTLARMYGFHVDQHTPQQPLRAMRERVVAGLQRLGWIDPIPGKNNGVYILRR